MKVYLSITIGNLSKYEEECKAYELGKGFISKNASWVAEDLNEGEFLNNEKLNLLVEMVDNQPEYKDKLIQFNPPQKLKGGRLVFELDEKNCPKTSSNFYHLCKGDKGLSKPSKKPLHYLNTTLFRVVSGYIAQGGDITRGS
ncbi:hypothetical protein K502DRAFT_324922 [Neoconidiobolus thromboides FSU 785]|nr:hypothetical protein K502DRAFT_324922 [Neoconidiobolus thromboides FSU 785]